MFMSLSSIKAFEALLAATAAVVAGNDHCSTPDGVLPVLCVCVRVIVCVCLCMYVCMYVRMRVCMYV